VRAVPNLLYAATPLTSALSRRERGFLKPRQLLQVLPQDEFLLFLGQTLQAQHQATGQSIRVAARQSEPSTTRSAPTLTMRKRRAGALWVR